MNIDRQRRPAPTPQSSARSAPGFAPTPTFDAPRTTRTPRIAIPDSVVVPELISILDALQPGRNTEVDFKKLEVLANNTLTNRQAERLAFNQDFKGAVQRMLLNNLGGDRTNQPGVPKHVYESRLRRTAEALDLLLKRRINPEFGAEEPALIDRLVRRINQFDLDAARKLAASAINAGCRLADVGVRCLLSDTLAAAQSLDGLKKFGSFAVQVLDRRVLDPLDEKNIRCMNYYLAILSDPTVVSVRLSPEYRAETDIIDVAQRLKVAADVALAVVRSDFRFTDDTNRSRINMTVRALATVGAALNLDRIQATERACTDETLADLKRTFGVHLDWQGTSPSRHVDDKSAELSGSLIRSALRIAEMSFQQLGNNQADGKLASKFEIDASTLNTLLHSIGASEFRFEQPDSALLCSLMKKCTQLRDVRIRLYSFALTAAMWQLYDSKHIPAADRAASLVAIATLPYFAQPERRLLNLIFELHEQACPDRSALSAETTKQLARLAHSARRSAATAITEPTKPIESKSVAGDPERWFSNLLGSNPDGVHLLNTIGFPLNS